MSCSCAAASGGSVISTQLHIPGVSRPNPQVRNLQAWRCALLARKTMPYPLEIYHGDRQLHNMCFLGYPDLHFLQLGVNATCHVCNAL